ncbi:hypothetical protein [Lederbergia citrisecunda]|uniref:hypothetical protein n=1 Tax=Lederbergia citrisecunda TaxID=2833583 RepID=UPI001F1D9014|nr:hypothetical protein [Lederbergia citrisecunda]
MNQKENFEADFLVSLNKMVKFPARIRFALFKDSKTNKQSIVIGELSRSLKSKKIENIKFNETRMFSTDGHSTTLHVGDYEDGTEVLEKVLQLDEIWCGTLVREAEQIARNQ